MHLDPEVGGEPDATPPAGPEPAGRDAGLAPISWGPAAVGLGILVAIGLLVVLQTALFLIIRDVDAPGALAAAQAALGASLIAAPFVVARTTGRTIGPANLGLRLPRRSWAWGLAAYGIYLAFIIAYASLIVEPEQEDVTRGLGADEGTLGLIVAALLIIAVAPFAEEVFFRGFMFGGFRRTMPLWPAAILSGAIFGLIHAPTGPAAIPPLVVLGVALAWLYERTGSLWPAIMIHAINNALAFSILVSS